MEVAEIVVEFEDGVFWYYCESCDTYGRECFSEREALRDSTTHEC